MKLDITMIKNESMVKFGKSLGKVADSFMDTLAIALNAAIHEIDQEKRKEVEQVLSDMMRDEFGKFNLSYARCMNKASEVIENSLNS